ncbi:MAG: hypothetical protein ACKVJE_20190 [Pseudomonadales bacterium]
MSNATHSSVVKVEMDPEFEAFLLSVRGYWTLEQLRQTCIARFGKQRTPSASVLYRYVDKLKYRLGGGSHVAD